MPAAWLVFEPFEITTMRDLLTKEVDAYKGRLLAGEEGHDEATYKEIVSFKNRMDLVYENRVVPDIEAKKARLAALAKAEEEAEEEAPAETPKPAAKKLVKAKSAAGKPKGKGPKSTKA